MEKIFTIYRFEYISCNKTLPLLQNILVFYDIIAG